MCAHRQTNGKIGEKNYMKNLSGKIFGKLRVLRQSTRRYFSTYLWVCRCVCNRICYFPSNELNRGRATHCGCAHGNKKHGEAHKSAEYTAWRNMHARCFNQRHPYFKDYGGRGITVTKRWFKFENFLADMGRCPAGLTLDRKNNDKGYSKRNCRWATRKVQQGNRRNSKRKSGIRKEKEDMHHDSIEGHRDARSGGDG